MKIKRIILPFLFLTLLLASCTKGTQEYDAAYDNMLQLGRDLAAFSSELDADIESNTDSYALLVSSYEKKGELLSDADELMSEITSLKDIISDEDYDTLVEKMHSLNENVENSVVKAEDYYELDVCAEVGALLDEYAQAQDKSKWDNTGSLVLIDQLNSLILKSEGLHDQDKILTASTDCIYSYSSWLLDSEDFASACQSSADKESSKELVTNYLETTTEYSDYLPSIADLESLMNESSSDNMDKFLEIHTAMSEEYERVIENLNFILQQ